MSTFLEKNITLSALEGKNRAVDILERRRLASMTEALSSLFTGECIVVCGDGFGECAGRYAYDVYRETGGGDKLRFMTRAELQMVLMEGGPDMPDSVIMFCLEERDEAVSDLLELAHRTGVNTAALSANCSCRPQVDTYIQIPGGGGAIVEYMLLLAHAALCALACCAAMGEVSAEYAEELVDTARGCLETADMGAFMSKASDAAALLKKEGIRCFDLVGDGTETAALDFCRLLLVRERGTFCLTENTEDWQHINFFERSAPEILTLFICGSGSPSFSRCEETASIAAQIGRPVVMITDSDGHDLPGGLVVSTSVPKGAPLWAETLILLPPAALTALEGSAALT